MDLEKLEDGCLDLRAYAPQGASQKNTSWQGPLQHRLGLPMETDPSLSDPLYSLRSDSPHQWSEHGPGTTSAGLWVTHNNDPITIPYLPPPLLFGVPDDYVKGADGTTPPKAQGEDSNQAASTFLCKNQWTSSMSYNKRSPRPTRSLKGRPSRGSPLIRICTFKTCLVFWQKK